MKQQDWPDKMRHINKLAAIIMDESPTYQEKYFKATSLVDLAYRDYIAARHLLNNDFIIQGLTLASTAIEKYLKSVIVFTLKEKERYSFHFDNFEKLKKILSKNDCDVTNKFDPVFIAVLKKAYKIRYYDNLKEPIEIGIFLNQFIGELDATISFLEIFIAEKHIGAKFTAYWRAIEKKDLNLYKNNFILAQQDKQKFMEEPGLAFSIYIQVGGLGVQRENTVVGKQISTKYNGCLSTFTEFQQNWFNYNRR